MKKVPGETLLRHGPGVPGRRELNLGNGRRLRQTRLRQGSVEIFYAMVADPDHHQAGVALGFQVKFLIEDRKIDPFTGW